MSNSSAEPFKELAVKCAFRQEWRVPVLSDSLNWSAFDKDYVAAGRARATPVTTFRNSGVVSVAVNEGHQQNVSGLPIGARTLFVDTSSSSGGTIVLRGLNKFIDVEDAPLRWMDHCAASTGVEVRLQRKMAGFICTLFALDDDGDNEDVRIATKHVLEGPHVDIATGILHTTLDVEKRRQLARELRALHWGLVCECICTSKDVGHPVPEPAEMDNTLFVLAAVHRSAAQELSVPFSELQAFATRLGLRVVPTTDAMRSRAELEAQLELRRPWNSALAEGWVICVELPVRNVVQWMNEQPIRSGAGPEETVQREWADWRVTIRLKAKTTRYRILRGIRSAITEGHTLDTGRLLRIALSCWYSEERNTGSTTGENRLSGPRSLEGAVKERGVFALLTEYEQSYIASRARVHFREALWSVKAAYQRLLSFYEHEQRVAMNAPLCVIMFCGIPGTGKSTVAKALESGIRDAPFVVDLRRDQVAHIETMRMLQLKGGGLNDARLSNKQQRRVQGAVHKHMRTLIHTAVRLAAASASDDAQRASPGVVVLDGCHATRSARQTWRAMFPSRTHLFVLVHLTCASPVTAARRVVRRADHETVRGEDEGQHAVSTIARKFELPEEDEADVILEFSTDSQEGEGTCSPSAATALIARDIAQKCRLNFEEEERNANQNTTVRAQEEERPLVLDADSLPDVLRRKGSELLYAITGRDNLLTAENDDLALSGLHHRRQKKASTKLAFVHLPCTQSDLLDIVSRAVRCAIVAESRTASSSSSPTSNGTDERESESKKSSRSSSGGGAGSLFTSFRKWFGGATAADPTHSNNNKCTTAAPVRQSTTQTVTTARGHVKWLRGWLKLHKDIKKEADPVENSEEGEEARIKRELALRFDNESLRASIERHHRHPHVTLFFCADYDAHAESSGKRLEELLELNAIPLGSQCDVHVHAVLMDRYAVCLRVTVEPSSDGADGVRCRDALTSQLHECDATKDSRNEDDSVAVDSDAPAVTPLHITVAYTSDVNAAYAGSLSSLFDAWEKSNNAVQAAKATKQIPTHRLTQHNFVELSLDRPIVLTGEVRVGDESMPPFSQP